VWVWNTWQQNRQMYRSIWWWSYRPKHVMLMKNKNNKYCVDSSLYVIELIGMLSDSNQVNYYVSYCVFTREVEWFFFNASAHSVDLSCPWLELHSEKNSRREYSITSRNFLSHTLQLPLKILFIVDASHVQLVLFRKHVNPPPFCPRSISFRNIDPMCQHLSVI
jgi:hypothetical protein